MSEIPHDHAFPAGRELASGDEDGFRAWLKNELETERLFYRLVVVFVTATLVYASISGHSFLEFLAIYFERVLRAIAMLVSVAIVVVAVQALVRRQEEPLAHIRRKLLNPQTRRYLTRFLFCCLVLNVIMAAFLYHKTLIPRIQPFTWDRTFIAWDRALFLGYDPWRLLHPLVGYPWITLSLDILYSAWVPIVFVFWGAIGATRSVSAALRRQYFVTTLLAWVLIGLVAATAFSSAGPCFLPGLLLAEAQPFAELNAYLRDVGDSLPMSTTMSKDYLWAIYDGSLDEPGGISAMPSMHNAQAVIFAAAAYRLNRRLGHLMAAYAVLIFVGSVHLAYHYAVDGLVGGAMALAIWWIVGKAVGARGALIPGPRAIVQ